MEGLVGPIKDPTISWKPGKKLQDFLRSASDLDSANPPITENLRAVLTRDDDVILKSHDVDWLNGYLSGKRAERDLWKGKELDEAIAAYLKSPRTPFKLPTPPAPYLHDLLSTSPLLLPPNPIIPRNPELQKRVERLQRQADERKYQKMTRNVDSTKKFIVEDTIAYQMNMMNRHLIAVGQFLLSVGAGFAFGFLGVQLMLGDLDFGFRLLLGVACALVIAIAEIYFLAKHLNDELLTESSGKLKKDKQEGPLTLSDTRQKVHRD